MITTNSTSKHVGDMAIVIWKRPESTKNELKSQNMSLLCKKTNERTGDVPSHNSEGLEHSRTLKMVTN